MGKHTDALGTLDNFRAPWETEGGTDAEIDKAKLRRWIFNVLNDKAKAQDARDDVNADLEKAKADLDEAKDEAASANGEEAQKKIDRLQAKVDSLTAEKDALVSANEQRELREEVLADFAREHPKAAKYVKGETREELEESLASVKEDFGISDEDGDDEDEEDEERNVRTTPRARKGLRNGADPDSGKPGDEPVDFDKAADEILGTSIFG